jgi:hypothetical protein
MLRKEQIIKYFGVVKAGGGKQLPCLDDILAHMSFTPSVPDRINIMASSIFE